MKGFIKFIKELFSSNYTKYTLHSTTKVLLPEYKQIPDPNVEYHSDPMDFINIPTGKFYAVIRQTWIAYHKKTGLPKLKQIDVPYFSNPTTDKSV